MPSRLNSTQLQEAQQLQLGTPRRGGKGEVCWRKIGILFYFQEWYTLKNLDGYMDGSVFIVEFKKLHGTKWWIVAGIALLGFLKAKQNVETSAQMM